MEKTNFSPFVILIIFLIRFLLSRNKSVEENTDREPNHEEADSPREQYEEEYDNESENEDESSYADESKTKSLFANCRTIEEVKKRFRRLSMLNHPDRGGSAAAMKVILAQYEHALERLHQNK